MIRKEFVTYETVRNNAILLARQIYSDGFIPDVIYVSLRGGAYVGNVISEFFKIVRKNDRPVFYAAVVARSYTDVRKKEKIRIDGWTYNPDYLRHGDRVLLVDDIFDSGKTINHLCNTILSHGIPRSDLKVAVHDYKVFHFKKSRRTILPDYYCRKIDINSPEEDVWIHYVSHEIVGLTEQEISHYYMGNKEIESILLSITQT